MTTEVGLGSCNLQNGGSGDKQLIVRTDLGSVDITFSREESRSAGA